MIRCLLLSAGIGSRLKPITLKIPKCLVPVRNKPILSHWIDFLKKNGVSEILVNTHYLHKIVEKFIRSNNYSDTIELTYEKSLLGTAGSILKNSIFFKNEKFLVAHADNYTSFDLKDFLNYHNNRGEGIIGTMMVFNVKKTEMFGIVERSNENIMTNFFEKKKEKRGNLANAAIYIFEPEIIKIIENIKKKKIDISLDLLPKLFNKLQVYENKDFVIDIGTNYGLDLANKIKGGF